MIASDALRSLPSVHQVAQLVAKLGLEIPQDRVVAATRVALDLARQNVLDGKTPSTIIQIVDSVAQHLTQLLQPSLRPVINATGVVLHTNLGRAPLGQWQPIPGYSNLEYDLTTGRRGKRDTHIQRPLEALLGRPAIAVNNGAAATFLALHEIAAGYEVIVSRGELIEIGDGFRIPDILLRSGAALCEVGTTNRTRLQDYRDAINARTRLILRVHPSNFHITGFSDKPSLQELAALGKEHGIPVYEDLGSGNLVDLRPYGISEPLVTESLAAGVNLVSFSGDKLLGGPQAGVLTGDADLVLRLRRNPLFRALRLDKFIHQAFEDTLRKLVLQQWDTIPALCMIRQTAQHIRERACQLFPAAELIPGESVIGGGSTPDQRILTTLIVAARQHAAKAERSLRQANPPVIGRISGDMLLLDLRTVFPEEEECLRSAVLSLDARL